MSKILIVGNNGDYSARTKMLAEILSEAGHEVVYEMPKPKLTTFIVDEWNMVNGSTINFSEIGRLDSIMLYGGARSGGKSWTLESNRKELETKLLTQPEKKATIAPSKLLVKLIGRIYED